MLPASLGDLITHEHILLLALQEVRDAQLSVLQSVRREFGRVERRMPAHTTLTPRETQVIELVRPPHSLANKEIADRLHLSERTIKFHVSRILAKFKVETRRAL